MNRHRLRLIISLVVLLLSAGLSCYAQSPSPSPSPSPPSSEAQEKLRVFTEEVVIPVTAYANSGHLDAFFEPDAVLVFEDDVRQVVRSVRRVPANVLLLLDTGGALNPLMYASTTRDIATKLISNLQSGDGIAAMQFGNYLELIQPWTTDRETVARALKNKLISGKRPQLAKALAAAALELKHVPAGTRHLVLITDGVDSSQDPAALNEGLTQLLNANVTVHVISYGYLGRKTIEKRNPLIKITNEKRKSASDLANEIMHHEQVPEYKKRNKVYVIIDTDFERRKKLKAYKEATKLSEEWLTSLAQETGGLVFTPPSVAEMMAPAEQIAREIDSQYVVTYTPKRPLAEATAGEYRRINVASRVAGTQMRARRGYVVAVP